MHTDATVNVDDVAQARARVREEGFSNLVEMIGQTEPQLYELIVSAGQKNAGKLTLTGTPGTMCRESADDLVETALIVFLSLQQSHARLWSWEKPPEDVGF
jgi:hypothetical protein